MAIHQTHERTTITYSYLEEDGSNPLDGKHVHVSAKSPDGKYHEVKSPPNNGHFALSFPDGWHGAFHCKVRGSDDGEVEAELEV